jgi:hypothetical protein
MSDGELARLDDLERTLVVAAEQQAQRRRVRRRRALAAGAVAVPLVLAATVSVAATGLSASIDQRLATLGDGGLGASPAAAVANGRTWRVAGRRITGHTTAGGSFCFTFSGHSGGCVTGTSLSRANPIDPMLDYGPRTFRVYGLAMDGVTTVSVHARGITQRAAVARNAFFLEADALGGTRTLSATLIVRLRDGTTKRLPIRLHPFAWAAPHRLPNMPGYLPAENTAA